MRGVAAKFGFGFPLAAAVLSLFSPFAAAEGDPASYSKPLHGLDAVINGRAAGVWEFSVGGQLIEAFCVQMNESLDPAASFVTDDTGALSIPNIAQAAWLAQNHAAAGTPLADVDREAAATQVAIWALTDAAVIDDTTVPNPETRARALELVAASAGRSLLSGGGADLAVTATDAPGSGKVVVSATLTDEAGAVMVGETISFSSSTGSSSAVTDGSGVARAELDAPASGVSGRFSASWSGAVGAGALVVPSNGSQALVLAGGFNAERDGSVSVVGQVTTTTTAQATTTTTTTAAPSTTVTSAVPTTATVAATVTAPVNSLPFTGGDDGPSTVAWSIAAGAAGAAVAGGVVVWRRRPNVR